MTINYQFPYYPQYGQYGQPNCNNYGYPPMYNKQNPYRTFEHSFI